MECFDGHSSVAQIKSMYVALSYDHRIIDGKESEFFSCCNEDVGRTGYDDV